MRTQLVDGLLADLLQLRCEIFARVASLLTSCDNAVPTTCQEGVFATRL